MEHFSGECQEKSDGKIIFNEGLKSLLKESMNSRDFDSEAVMMAKLVKVIRHEIFEWNSFHFTGSFPQDLPH